MRSFSSLDPLALKAFFYVAHTLHFTRAAKAASLTQSGVSQHVKRLEEELGVALFHRDPNRIRLTDAGRELLAYVDLYLDSVDQLRERLLRSNQDLSGLVRYAMPDSCLYTPHFPLLLERRQKDFPGIQLQVRICPSEEVVDLLRKREIDFGFVSKSIPHTEIESREFATEEYVLVAASKSVLRFQEPSEILRLPFISYPGMEDLFAHWVGEEFPRHRTPGFHDLQLAAEINSLRGALTLVAQGLGAAIFQRHCVQELLHTKQAYAYQPRSGARATNKIYVVSHLNEAQPARVRKVLDTFAEMKSG